VSEFARLKPRELLMATEKSMLNGQLLNLHLQLIDRKKELNNQQHVRCHYGGSLPRVQEHLAYGSNGEDYCKLCVSCTACRRRCCQKQRPVASPPHVIVHVC